MLLFGLSGDNSFTTGIAVSGCDVCPSFILLLNWKLAEGQCVLRSLCGSIPVVPLNVCALDCRDQNRGAIVGAKPISLTRIISDEESS